LTDLGNESLQVFFSSHEAIENLHKKNENMHFQMRKILEVFSHNLFRSTLK